MPTRMKVASAAGIVVAVALAATLWLIGIQNSPKPTVATPTKQQDPYLLYMTQVNKVGGIESGRKLQDSAADRAEYDTARAILCAMSKQAILDLKALAGANDAPIEGRKPYKHRKLEAKLVANSYGAMWEFGCKRGHDPEIYKPRHVTNEPIATPEPPEPAVTEEPAEPMTDANGEAYEEYCQRTGQPLDNCAAG